MANERFVSLKGLVSFHFIALFWVEENNDKILIRYRRQCEEPRGSILVDLNLGTTGIVLLLLLLSLFLLNQTL